MKFSNIALIAACTLATASFSEAHVKMIYKANQAYPIRNADGATADGKFSTSGYCGGQNEAYGANGVAEINVDQEVCLTINYNGGHKSAAQNKFKMYAKCDADGTTLTQAEMEASGTAITLIAGEGASDIVADGAEGYVAAPDGNIVTEGYTLCGKIPAAVGAPGQACTLAIGDLRPFGSCVDLKIAEAPVVPPEPKPNTNTFSDIEGVYEIKCDAPEVDPADACNVCCTEGHVAIDSQGSVFVKYATKTGSDELCPPQDFNSLAKVAKGAISKGDLPGSFITPQNQWIPIVVPEIEGVSSQAFEIKLNLKDPENPALGKQIAFQNMDAAVPRVCDALGEYKMTLQAAKDSGIFAESDLTGGTTVPPANPNTNQNGGQGVDVGVIGGIAGAAVALVGAMAVYNKRRQSASGVAGAHMSAPGMPAKPMGMQQQAGNSAWRATVDPNTGKTYYYNQATGETSWTAPVSY